jgi:hypothetical protein
VSPKGAEPTLGLPREACSGPEPEGRRSPSKVDEERLVSAPFARVRSARAQPSFDQLHESLGAFRCITDEAKSQASLDGQDLRAQPLRGIAPLALPQESLESLHGSLQAGLLGLSPPSPIVQLEQVSHGAQLRVGV